MGNPAIANDARQYNGAGYTFGGQDRSVGDWDCSSFVNWVIGKDLHMAIPGYRAGQFNGGTHGPVVVDWAVWGGCTTIPGPPEPGDLCIWPGVGALGHIGIALSGTQMISAVGTGVGTKIQTIPGRITGHGARMFRSVNSGAITTPTNVQAGNPQATSADQSLAQGCLPLIGMVAIIGYAIRSSTRRRRV